MVNSLPGAKVSCFSVLLSRLLLSFPFHSSLFLAFTGCLEKSVFSFMRQPMPIKPSLISAWTGRTWGHCWCLTRCSVGFCVCVVCPWTSHILKVEVKKMGYTHSRNIFLVSLSWAYHLNRVFGSYEGEAGDFIVTARLPQEETDGVVSWARESPLPSLVGGRGEAKSSALSTRMQSFHQKSEIVLPGSVYLPWGSWCLWFQPARTWGFL